MNTTSLLSKQLFQRIAELLNSHQIFALATLVEAKGSTPQKSTARMIVFPDGTIEGTVGGGILEKRVIEEAVKIIPLAEDKLFHFQLTENQQDSLGAVCGGEVSVFIEVMGASPRLFIMGAGHIARSLSGMAVVLPFEVVVYDDRPDWADPQFFSKEVQVICASFDKAFETLQPRPQDFIAIMTYNHQHDFDVLYQALLTPCQYVGLVASQRKMHTFYEQLVQKGISEDRIKQIHAPIGLPIGGHTPAEISISILAEMIQCMHQMTDASNPHCHPKE